MTTVREVITLGLQLARVIPLGRDPKANESEAGLTILQGLYDSMFADGQFSALTDVYATSDYTAKENERIIADSATISIPDTIEVEADTARTPRDLSAIVVITDVAELHYVFSGGRWEICHGLTLDSDAPLATRGKDGLAALLALYFAEAFGTQLGPMWTRRANQFRGSLAYKIGSTRDIPVGEYY
jgi:hypothetical protein